jgi:hypothetical protein
MNRNFIIVLCLAALLQVPLGCSSAVTAARMGEVKPGMKASQVEALLGPPAQIEQAETTGLRGEVYCYPAPDGQGRVVFLNDAVFKAEFVPGGRKS